MSRDDVDGDSPILIHELPPAESSDNDKTYELPDDYIVTVRLHELSCYRMSRLRLTDCVAVVHGCVVIYRILDFESNAIVSSRLVVSSPLTSMTMEGLFGLLTRSVQ